MFSWIFGSSEDNQEKNVKQKENPIEDENKDEPKKVSKKRGLEGYPELDLVFAMDTTSSMGSYINSAKDTIIDIVTKITASEKADVRFSYVAYRDHCDKNSSFLTKVHDFTDSSRKMKDYVLKVGPVGGGDGPEAVAPAMDKVLKLPYRKNAVKIVVLILDAPPHGVIDGSGDDYPNGDPKGLDCIKMAREMAKRGIVLYVVACEPSLSGYVNAHDFMAGLAKITEGKYLPLTSAHLLPDVIIGGAKEEIALQKLEEEIENDVKQLKKEKPKIKEEEILAHVSSKMKARGHKFKEVQVEDLYGESYDCANISSVYAASSMKDAKKNMKTLKQPAMKSFGRAPSYNSYRSSAMAPPVAMQKVEIQEESLADHHVSKLYNRSKNKGGW